MNAAQTPLTELLAEVPEDIVLGFHGDGPFPSYTNVPIGALARQAREELRRLSHNIEVLTNALWKACGDDEEVVNATIESQGELK